MPQPVAASVQKRSGGRCEAATPDCTHRAEHLHHRLMRSQGGPDRAANLLHVCAACHRFIHDNPAMSYETGWLLRRNS